MPIYTKPGKRILHVHIPKTAGTSVTQWAHDCGWEVDKFEIDDGSCPWAPHADNIPGHEPWDLSHATYETWSTWGEFDHIFAIVRDPVERMQAELDYSLVEEYDIDRWTRRMFNICRDNDPRIQANHIRPQSDFLGPGCEVIHFDSWEQRVGEILEAGDVPVPHLRRRHKEHYTLSPGMVMLIKKFYEIDYQTIFKGEEK